MRKKGVAQTNLEIASLVAQEWARKSTKEPDMAKSAVAGEGVCRTVEGREDIDVKKLGQLSEARLKTIYKRLTGKSYE